MNAHNCHCADRYRRELSDSRNGHRRFGWRKAIAALTSPMIRLHQLRNVRTQILRDALARHDCNNNGCDDA